MTDVHETVLPGVGVRHELTTAAGERVALLTYRSGQRELVVYDRDDPDSCRTVLHLSAEDGRALAVAMGADLVP